jgi:hypothetical protein
LTLAIRGGQPFSEASFASVAPRVGVYVASGFPEADARTRSPFTDERGARFLSSVPHRRIICLCVDLAPCLRTPEKIS